MVLISPSRRPTHATSVSVAKIDDDLFSILGPHDTVGFVHKVGPVYVALHGSELNHAVEVGQALSWDRAVEIVRSS